MREEGDELLWVHQTADQRRLLLKYGEELCLLDATHKTTRYSMPLFFVVIKTNTIYQVVAEFIVSSETTTLIRRALERLLEWNPTWKPRFWMTDQCQAEITAIEQVHPGMFQQILFEKSS